MNAEIGEVSVCAFHQQQEGLEEEECVEYLFVLGVRRFDASDDVVDGEKLGGIYLHVFGEEQDTASIIVAGGLRVIRSSREAICSIVDARFMRNDEVKSREELRPPRLATV